MFKKRVIGVIGLVLVLVFTAALSAQAAGGSLTTTFAGGNGHNGNMFDVTALVDLTITSFDVNLYGPETQTVSVFYKVGSYVGSETAPGAWTMLGSVAVTGAGTNVPTYLPVGGLFIPAGATYGIYVSADGGGVNYTDGSAVYSTAEMQLSAGIGVGGLFGSDGTYAPRIWNGTVYYNVGAGPAPAVPGPDMVAIPSGAVVGMFLVDTPIYWAPQSDAATSTVMQASKTAWVYGVDASGAYYKVMLAGKFFWVPLGTMGPNPDAVWHNTPLPTGIVK